MHNHARGCACSSVGSSARVIPWSPELEPDEHTPFAVKPFHGPRGSVLVRSSRVHTGQRESGCRGRAASAVLRPANGCTRIPSSQRSPEGAGDPELWGNALLVCLCEVIGPLWLVDYLITREVPGSKPGRHIRSEYFFYRGRSACNSKILNQACMHADRQTDIEQTGSVCVRIAQCYRIDT